jgi:hypothetical protein
MSVIVLVCLIALAAVRLTGAAAAAAVECANLGFTEALECSTCESLAAVGLGKECEACCHVPSEEKYALIVLEVDKRSLEFYSTIAEVVKEAKKDDGGPFSDLVVRYQFNARPQLHLYVERDDEYPADSVSVYSWSKDVILDFIKSNKKDEA